PDPRGPLARYPAPGARTRRDAARGHDWPSPSALLIIINVRRDRIRHGWITRAVLEWLPPGAEPRLCATRASQWGKRSLGSGADPDSCCKTEFARGPACVRSRTASKLVRCG